jgi:hypothetical protein
MKKIVKQVQLFTDWRFEMRTITSFVRAYIVTTQNLMKAISIFIRESVVFSFFLTFGPRNKTTQVISFCMILLSVEKIITS